MIMKRQFILATGLLLGCSTAMAQLSLPGITLGTFEEGGLLTDRNLETGYLVLGNRQIAQLNSTLLAQVTGNTVNLRMGMPVKVTGVITSLSGITVRLVTGVQRIELDEAVALQGGGNVPLPPLGPITDSGVQVSFAEGAAEAPFPTRDDYP